MRSLHRLLFCFGLTLLLCPGRVPAAAITEAPLAATERAFRQVLCLDQQRFDYYKGLIRALSYPAMRTFRVFCSLDGFTAEEAIETLERLVFYPLRYDQVRILEKRAADTDLRPAECWQLLAVSGELEFTASQAATALASVRHLPSKDFFELLQRLSALDDSGRWAATALLGIEEIPASSARTGLSLLERMNPRQRWSAEKAAQLDSAQPQTTLELLHGIAGLEETDAVNFGGLLSQPGLTAKAARHWLEHYFSLPLQQRPERYRHLPAEAKTTLLAGFFEAAETLIWKINDLHSVTNDFGVEISSSELHSVAAGRLRDLFARLHPEARGRHGSAFSAALEQGQRNQAVARLRQATALTRRLTARDLTEANLYILLSRGSELYDSSFRDILVPELLGRLSIRQDPGLLPFLKEIDPENGHVSDFIISCAQKGKLTAFFPADPGRQRQVLDLVTESAFRSEQSLILFSATFNTLLNKLSPEVRSYLIDRMINTIDHPESLFSLQLRVILQYYREKHPELLAPGDLEAIETLVRRYGSVDLAAYTATDFSRWKRDGRLASLSVFQADDDGSSSYRSNSRHLLAQGYQPRLSRELQLLPANAPAYREAQRLLEAERRQPGSQLTNLYRLSVREPVIFEWHKQVNGFELSHAVAVYHNRHSQQRLLQQFLEGDFEMFAQRGHSYWRRGQLLEPLQQLQAAGELPGSGQQRLRRFMSIGSCGGIRVYSELNRLFNNQVDILATVGTGKAVVNDPYNRRLFEIIASSPDSIGWEDIARKSAPIFEGRGSDYLQPGSLPAILHKIMDRRPPS